MATPKEDVKLGFYVAVGFLLFGIVLAIVSSVTGGIGMTRA